MDDMSQVVLNPIRMRIIQHLATREKVTAGELGSLMPDIARTTLYRHVKKLVKANILTVVSENRIRGTVEKVYSLNSSTLSAENTTENATRNAFSFLMQIYADFDRYFADAGANPGKDKIFLNKTVLMLSDQEYDQFFDELRKILVRYLGMEPTTESKPRNLSIISAPNIE